MLDPTGNDGRHGNVKQSNHFDRQMMQKARASSIKHTSALPRRGHPVPRAFMAGVGGGGSGSFLGRCQTGDQTLRMSCQPKV